MHTHHIRSQEINRLSEHPRFGFDTSDTPSNHSKSIDHGRVRIGTHQSIGIIYLAGIQYAFCKVFQINLMDDSDTWWNHLEGIKSLHPPFQELVSFPVSSEFLVQIAIHGVSGSCEIHLDRVVDDQIDRNERLDDFWILIQTIDGRTHCGKINQQGDSREVLQDDTSNDKWDFGSSFCIRLPLGQLAYTILLDLHAIAIPKDGFQDNADRNRQA